MVWANAPF